MTPFDIRPATPDDCRRIPAIERAAAVRFRDVGLGWLAEADPNPPAFIEACRRDGAALVAVRGGAPIGFALAGLLDRALHIYEVSVHPDFGRRGAGRQLIAALESAARQRGIAGLTLSTFVDIPWNGPFYASLGFVPVLEADWSPAMHLLRGIETALSLPIDRRGFMRKPLA